MSYAEARPKTSAIDVLRKEFTDFAGTLGLDPAMQDACLGFILEKTRVAWMNGKEFGWKKAWAWKRENGAKAAAA